MDLIGKRLGKYRITSLLGRGGMASVYEAFDDQLGRRLAIKVLDIHRFSAHEDVVRRFENEARIIAQLSHPNIVPVYDFGWHENTAYFVSPLVAGDTLSSLIAAGPMEVGRVCSILSQVASALDYAHSRGVIHRDVKPSNIIVEENGHAHLMDFGIAKYREEDRQTQTGEVVGTIGYMAPEALRAEPIDLKVDIYALGLVAFEMLAGSPAFTADSMYERMRDIVEARKPRLSQLRPGLAPSIEAAIEKASSPLREERFSSAIEFINSAFSEKGTADNAPPNRPQRNIGALLSSVISWVTNPPRETPAANLPASNPPLAPPHASAQKVLPPHETSLEPTQPEIDISGVFGSPVPPPIVNVPALPDDFERMFGTSGNSPPPPPPPPPLGAFTGMFLSPPLQPAAAPPRKPPPVPPPPGPPTADPFKDSGEFTRMFQTRPSGVEPTKSPAPSAAPSEAGLGEFTRTFFVPSGAPSGAEEATLAEPALPDVSLTIASCSDTRFVGQKADLTSFPFRIGRSGPNFKLPFDSAVSAEHAEIDFKHGRFTVRDLGSANGTYVNGKCLLAGQSEPLLFPAEILLGSNTQLFFQSNELQEIPDLTGKIVGDRYTLTEKLHASAKSVIYAARHKTLRRTCAVKILSPRLARLPGYREQFAREAETASDLDHPNICRVSDYGETSIGPEKQDESLYICMDYLAGGSLSTRLARNDNFAIDRILAWLQRICDALDYIHQRHVIHGAIKPSAIVFDSREVPYLTDFAVATTPEASGQRTVIGAPGYLAPEQFEGKDPIPATDQYSLAVLIYTLISGSPPYEGQEYPKVRRSNFFRGPMLAHKLAERNRRQAVPATVSEVLDRAMAVDPAERFGSAPEFARAFEKSLEKAEPAESARPVTVFLSYHRASCTAWALFLKSGLENRYKFDVFLDSEQRDTAGPFPEKLEKNVGRRDVFVCILAEPTLLSAWVKREIEFADAAKKPMIPVFLESFVIPPQLETLEPHLRKLLEAGGVKILDRQNIYVDAAVEKLAALIKQSVEYRKVN